MPSVMHGQVGKFGVDAGVIARPRGGLACASIGWIGPNLM